MNHTQRGALGTAVIAMFVAAFFFIPWRADETNELVWSPFYRNPVAYEASYMDGTTQAVFRQVKGRRAWGVYALQFFVIGAAGWIAFTAAADDPDDDPENESVEEETPV